MSTLASLAGMLGQMPNIRPWDIATRSQNEADTGLIELQQLKEKQVAEQEFLLRVKNDPALAQQLFGGSVLGSLQTAPGGPPATGPMTQQQVMPGQPAGTPQIIPGGQDLSQFATQGGPPPQSTLASLGPQPQGGMQAPQNPVLEMARTNPRAAMLLQGQMQQAQDRQWKMQEQGLSNRIKVVDYLARMAQGATDQDSWKAFIDEADRVQPGAGGRLPQMYSREARDRVVAQGLDAKETMTLQVAELKAQSDMRGQLFKEQQAAAGVPKYTEDSTLNVAIDRRMQQAGIPRGTPPSAAILTQAQEDVETGKIRVSASQGTGQVFDTDEGKKRLRPGTNIVEPLYTEGGQPLRPKSTQAEQTTSTFANLARKGHESAVALEEKGFKPGFWAKAADKLPLDMGNYLTSEDYQKYKDYVTDFAQAWLRETSKGAITEDEWNLVNRRYFPQPGNSKAQIEAKRQAREQVIKELEAVGKGTGRTGTQEQSQGQAPAATAGKPASQMSPEEIRAEIAAIKARGGR